MQEDELAQIRACASELQHSSDADIYLYFGSISLKEERQLLRTVRGNPRHRPNAMLILATTGGSPDSAFRISRCLQANYSGGNFILFVDDICKSAGTLLALGANEIVMSDGAELGPLDIQLSKPDEIDERVSGLTLTQSLSTLRNEASLALEQSLVKLTLRLGITTKTAAELATKFAVGLFEPIYSQINPITLGENERALVIAEKYGSRLARKGNNVKNGGLDRLIAAYPSHEFVIERTEAEEIFENVRRPSDVEKKLGRLLSDLSESIIYGPRESVVTLLNPKLEEGNVTNRHNGQSPNDDEGTQAGTTANGGTAENDHEGESVPASDPDQPA